MWEIKGLEETDLPRVADLELAIFPDAWSLPHCGRVCIRRAGPGLAGFG
mgnify:CR=1 FL=1